MRTSASAAASTQGTAAADDAIARAAALGLAAGTPIYFDLEGYAVDNPTCSATVQAFVAGWVNELHAHGYVAGVYGSAASTIRDLQSLGTSIPDSVWIANWNGQESVFGDPYVSDALWTSHQRIHQFRGGHREAYGGITINIDSSYVDGPVVAATGTAPPPVAPPPITPPPAPPAVSTAGSVSSGDGQATVSWPAGTFSQSVVVSLTPAGPTRPVPGFGGGYGVQLAVSQTASAAPPTGFAAPLTIRFVPQPGNVVALFSTDGTTWKTVAPLVDGGLAAGAPAGFSREGNGSIEILTSIPGLFALLPDTTRPTRPATLDGRLSHGSLLLRWPRSTDNSGRVESYEVTLTNRPLLTVTGKPAAAVRSFHRTAPSVYRVVAIDDAGNESVASKPVVVLPTRRPAKLPKAIPRWAFALFVWQQAGKPKPRPDAPRIVPAWYWQWAAWRATPFHIRRPYASAPFRKSRHVPDSVSPSVAASRSAR